MKRRKSSRQSVGPRASSCLAALIVIVAAGCGMRPSPTVMEPGERDADFIRTNYAAVEHLLDGVRTDLPEDARIVVGTFVSLDDLSSGKAEAFGRMSAEQAATALARYGYAPMNLNVRETSVAIIRHEGQFILSRDIQNLSSEYDAEAALVGTYSIADSPELDQGTVYVSMHLIRIADNTLVGSTDYVLPLGPKLRVLLGMRPRVDAASKDRSVAAGHSHTSRRRSNLFYVGETTSR